MKSFFYLLIFVLLISQVSAVSLDIKNNYQPGETLITEISGVISKPISKSQISFYTGKFGNVPVPLNYDVQRLGDKYFLYANLPYNIQNYTIKLEDIETVSSGYSQNVDLSYNFTVTGEQILFSISPGFATTSDFFSLDVFSNSNQQETISVNFPEVKVLQLNPGENSFSLSTSSLNSGLTLVDIEGLYSLPIFVTRSTTTPNQTITNSSNVGEPLLSFYPTAIEGRLLRNATNVLPFKIANTGTSSANDITIRYNESLFTITSIPASLAANSSIELNITIKSSNSFEDKITILSGSQLLEIPIVVSFTENPEQVRTPYLSNYSSRGYLCAELSGSFCTTSQTCSGSIVAAINGNNCCKGQCVEIKKSSYSWVGYVLGGILVLLLGYLVYKFRKAKSVDLAKN